MWLQNSGGRHYAATPTAPRRRLGWLAAVLAAAIAAALVGLAGVANATTVTGGYKASVSLAVEVPTACFKTADDAVPDVNYTITNGPVSQDVEVTLRDNTAGVYLIKDAPIGTQPAGGVFSYQLAGDQMVAGHAYTMTVAGSVGGTDTVTFTMPRMCQPDDKVVYTDWTDGEKSCQSKTVAQTRTKTVTPYVWNGTAWVLGTPVTTTETRTRPMTDAELKVCAGNQKPTQTKPGRAGGSGLGPDQDETGFPFGLVGLVLVGLGSLLMISRSRREANEG